MKNKNIKRLPAQLLSI